MINNFKFEKIEDLSEDVEKSFSPIRKIIKSDDIFEKFTKKSTEETDLFLLFAFESNILNYSRSSFIKPYLGDIFFDMELIEMVFNFLSKHSNNKDLKNILEDTRIAIQSFIININLKNFYNAMVVFRKLIESSLWIENFVNDSKSISRERLDDEESFNSQLKKSKKKKHFFNWSSKIIHSRNVIFGTISDKEPELLNLILKIKYAWNEAFPLIVKIYEIDELKDNLIFSRLMKLCKRFEKNKPQKIKIMDYDDQIKIMDKYEIDEFIKKNDKPTNEEWTSFGAKIMDSIKSIPERAIELFNYNQGLIQSNNEFGLKLIMTEKEKNETKKLLSGFYNDELFMYIPLLFAAKSNILRNVKKEAINTENKDEYLKFLIKVNIDLFTNSIKHLDKINEFLFLRKMLEEYIVAFSVDKFLDVFSIIRIYEFLKSKGLKLKKINSFDFKHIQKEKRGMYINSDLKITGYSILNFEDIKYVLKKLKNDKWLNTN